MKKMAVGVNLTVDAELWRRVLELAQQNGVSGAFAVRRALVYMITTGHIFWPTEEKKETLPTPVYDLENEAPVKGARTARKGPVGRVQ